MYLGVSLIYKLGFNSVRVKGVKVDFNREFDNQLFKIDSENAFTLSSSNSISIVKYKKSIFPLCLVCGKYEPNGTVVNIVEYKNDEWFYSEYTTPFYEAYEIKTKEFIDSPEEGDLKSHPTFLTKQLSFADNHKINIEYIVNHFDPLTTLNESCMIFNFAFFILIGGWLLYGIFYALFIRKRT